MDASSQASSSLYYRVVAYAALGVLVFSFETLGANYVGRPLPLAAWYFLPGVLTAAAMAAAVVLTDGFLTGRMPAADWIWCALAAGVLGFHAYRLPGVDGVLPGAAMAGLFLAVFGGRRWLGFGGGAGLFLLVLLLSSDWMEHLHELAETTRGLFLSAGLLLVFPGIMLVVLWLLERNWLPRLAHPAWSFGSVALVLVFSGAVFAHWWTVQPDSTFQSRFRGTLPDVRRTGESGVGELPNIILISIDTLRWDLVPPRTSSDLRLPHLEQLRRDSMVFPRHFSTSSATLRSHASLFSGLLPPRHGARKRSWRIKPGVWLYPQLLRKLGYRTGGFVDGGWVSRQLGFSRGYDRYWQYPLSYEEMVPGVVHYLEFSSWLADQSFLLRVRGRGVSGDYLREFRITVKRGLDWIGTVRRGPVDRPFYLFLHTYQVHDYKRNYPAALARLRENHPELLDAPFTREILLSSIGGTYEELRRISRPDNVKLFLERLEPSQREQHRQFVEELNAPQEEIFSKNLRLLGVQNSLRDLELSDRERRRAKVQFKGWMVRGMKIWKQLYRYGLEEVDQSLGILLDGLRDRGIYEETLIVFLSDHGEGFRENGTATGHGHGQLHEVLVRTPLFIKLPHQKRREHREMELVQITDVFPSLFHYLGIHPTRPPETAPDRPRTDLLTTGGTSPRKLVRGLIGTKGEGSRPNLYVRSNSYKLIESKNDFRAGWYRVRSGDLTERSVPEDEVPPPQKRLISREMARYLTMHGREPGPSDDTNPGSSPALKRALEGLGYLD